ncbi:MAG: NUDIX hydrolase [Ruminococcus sp.]|jgi:ADP-ribose pyrophosphatase|nr:NUDIX hydrolase [Ruminococcus sp.]
MRNVELYFEYINKYPDKFTNADRSGTELVCDKAGIMEIEEIMKRRMRENGKPEEWAEIGVVYQDCYITILRDAVLFKPHNTPGTYIRQFNAGSVCGVVILPICGDEVCLLRIFRHSLRRYVYELPRGFGNLGETEEQNALREFNEEVGGTVRSIHCLGYVYENTGISDSKTALFLAEIERETKPSEPDESIDKVFFMHIPEFLQMISDGRVEDGFTLAAVSRALVTGVIKLKLLLTNHIK